MAPDEIILAQIGKDERLLWAGRPVAGIRFKRSDILMVPFSIMWGGFAIFWEIMVYAMGAPLLFRIWGIPFVLVGLYMIVGRFFTDARVRAQTVYGVTNERVLIVVTGWRRRVTSLAIRSLCNITLTENRHGGGVIALAPIGAFPFAPPQGFTLTYRQIPALDLSQDARLVYELIREGYKLAQTGLNPVA